MQLKGFKRAAAAPGVPEQTAPRRVIYLIATSGHPNYGDEVIAATWLRWLAKHEPDADVWLDCPAPGPAATVLRGLHPRLRVTDTVFRLAWEAPSESPLEVAAFVQDALCNPGVTPRWVAGIDVLGEADVVHVLGGGYVNDLWPRHLGLLAAGAWAARHRGARFSVTGQGLVPAVGFSGPLLTELLSGAQVVDVRDEPSADLLRENGVAVSLSCDDLMLGVREGLLHPDPASLPAVMVCVQTDQVHGDIDGVLTKLLATLRAWGVKGPDVGFVECIPRVDRHAYVMLEPYLPGARFFSLWEILEAGFPAAPHQRWISTRFHPHLIAASAGARGAALAVDPEYYPVKHGSLIAQGSGWEIVSGQAASDLSSQSGGQSGAGFGDRLDALVAAKTRIAERVYR